jgi:hypothetical protein
MEDDAGVEGTIHGEVSATDIVPIDLDGVRVRSDALELAILLQSVEHDTTSRAGSSLRRP